MEIELLREIGYNTEAYMDCFATAENPLGRQPGD